MENNFTLPKTRLRAKQAAEYLGISFSLLEKMRFRSDGPVYAKLGRAIIYEIGDLDNWVNAKKRRSTLEA
jgi:hypothetical protein